MRRRRPHVLAACLAATLALAAAGCNAIGISGKPRHHGSQQTTQHRGGALGGG